MQEKYKLEPHPVKINSNIRAVQDFYHRYKIPYTTLLTDYETAYMPGKVQHVINPYRQRQENRNAPYERGATIAETALLTEALKLKNELPTDVIRALFYADHNDAAVECGMLFPLLSQISQGKACVINPSPDFLVESYRTPIRYEYIVTMDETIRNLYSEQFKYEEEYLIDSDTDYSRFYTVEKMEKKPGIDTYLILQRRYQDLDILFKPLSLHNPTATVLALLSNSVIDSHNVPFWQALDNNKLYINKIVRIDPTAISKPKRSLFIISTEKTDRVQLIDTAYEPESHELFLINNNRSVDAEILRTGEDTIVELLKERMLPQTEKSRLTSEYRFSEEISISYSIKQDRSGSPKITACYHAIVKKGEHRQRGKRLTDDLYRRIGKRVKEEVLEEIPFDAKCWAAIRTNVLSSYGSALEKLSLKTCWFLIADKLSLDREYNEHIAHRLFRGSSDLTRLRLAAATEQDVVEAVGAALGCRSNVVTYQIWRQLDIIIRKLIREGYATSNPIDKYVQSRSERLTDEEKAIRNALVKKTLEPEEELRIIRYICEADETGVKRFARDFLALAVAIKIFTGLSNGELCALLWEDWITLGYGLGTQFRITKYLNQQSVIEAYTAHEIKRIRFIPVPKELEVMVTAFFHNMIQITGLSEKEMLKKPVISSMNDLKRNENQYVTTKKMNKYMNRVLKIAGIDPKVVTLHSGNETKEMDLNAYEGDFFRENAYYHFRQICSMKEGESCYVIGKTGPTTFDRNYLDYANDMIQHRMAAKMKRWLCKYDELIGIEHPDTQIGFTPLKENMELKPDGKHSCYAVMLFEKGCAAGEMLLISSTYGISYNITKEGVSRK